MIEIVPATPEIVRSFGMDTMRSARMLAVIDTGLVLGIAGLYPDGNRQVAFMELSSELKRHPRAIVRAGRIFMKWVRESRLPVHALCDEEIAHAASHLEHWGFRRIYKGIYAWHP